MTTYDQLIEAGIDPSEIGADGPIILQDDSDGIGAYIREWNTKTPVPDGITIGKPVT